MELWRSVRKTWDDNAKSPVELSYILMPNGSYIMYHRSLSSKLAIGFSWVLPKSSDINGSAFGRPWLAAPSAAAAARCQPPRPKRLQAQLLMISDQEKDVPKVAYDQELLDVFWMIFDDWWWLLMIFDDDWWWFFDDWWFLMMAGNSEYVYGWCSLVMRRTVEICC